MNTASTQPDDLEAYLAAVARSTSYVVERTLSSGEGAGMTELVRFRASDDAMLGPFVRKRIDLSQGIGGAYEMLAEAERAGRRFRHLPRIVECYKTGTELVVVSEYVSGRTLEEEVAACGAGAELAQRVFPELCEAVAELHEAFDPPLIHRDLKPANIIVAPDGLFLIDFGIARRFHEGVSADTVRFGTRAYAPPEQYGFGQTDVRSDIYALGMLLWYCLVGEQPPVPFDAAASARVGIPYAEIVARATAFDPEARYPSARALESAFVRVTDGGTRMTDGGMNRRLDSESDATNASVENAADVLSNVLSSDAASGPVTEYPQAGLSRHLSAMRSDDVQRQRLDESGRPNPNDVRHTRPDESQHPHSGKPERAHADKPGRAHTDEPEHAHAAEQSTPSHRGGKESLRARIAAQLARIPTGFGIAWNILVLLVYALFAAGCIFAVVEPNEEDLVYPVWFRVLEYLGMMFLWFTVIAYVLLDKRRLRKRIPALAGRTVWQDIQMALLVIVISLTVTVVARMVLG